ncbi:MAG: hypothetical protein AAGA45_05065, partial [Verrucomicrobiota bacterium]
NGGGRIFDNLPIAQFDPPYERYFATPQVVDFAALCTAHGITHERPKSWTELTALVQRLPKQGLRVIEVVTDPERDVPLRRQILREGHPSAEGKTTAPRKRSRRRAKPKQG